MRVHVSRVLAGLVVVCACAAGANPAVSASALEIQRSDALEGERTSELAATAMSFLGVPYRRGGNSAESGFDCSGLVRATYNQTVGHLLACRAEEQAAATQKIDRVDLKPDDLVFFNTMRRAFSHVGIYVGSGRFIHAPNPGAQVRVEDMEVRYWQRRFSGARRVELAQKRA